MRSHHQSSITYTSKLLIIFSKIFFPSMKNVYLSKGNHVSDAEMFTIGQDRLDANPHVFHPHAVIDREIQKRNILVSLLRRKLWQRGCLIGASIYVASSIAFDVLNFGIEKTQSGVAYISNKIKQSAHEEKSKEEQVNIIKKQVVQLKEDCSSGKTTNDECTSQMQALKQQYESINNKE